MARRELSDLDLWAAACERAWKRPDRARGSKEERRAFLSLSSREQWLVALMAVDNQIVNGGFSQLYCNEMGWMAPAAATGLRTVGLEEAAELVELAHKTFQPENDTNDGVITDALEELSDRLSSQYSKLTGDCLDSRVAGFLRNNQTQ